MDQRVVKQLGEEPQFFLEGTDTVVACQEYQGVDLVTVRDCWEPKPGELALTKRGVSIPKEMAEELIVLLMIVGDVDLDDLEGAYEDFISELGGEEDDE